MAADPTVTTFGQRGLTGNEDVATADIADGAVTAAKMATDAVSGDTIAALGVDAGKLNLGAVSTSLAVASAVIKRYHMGTATVSVAASRDIAYTDLEGGILACTGPITLTVPLDMTSTGSTGWRTGQFTLIECANASTVTLAAAGGVTLTAPSGLVLDGAGACGILARVGTNSWRFTVLSGNTFLPVAGIDATGTPSSTTYLRGDGTWSEAAAHLVAPASGLYVGPHGTISIGAPTLNRLYFVPWLVRRTLTIDALAVYINVAAAAGGTIRAAIYTDGGGTPDTLIEEVSGVTDATTADALVLPLAGDRTLTPGLYFLATVYQTTVTTLSIARTTNTGDAELMALPSLGTAPAGVYLTGGVSGALPSPVTSGGGTITPVNNVGLCWARMA